MDACGALQEVVVNVMKTDAVLRAIAALVAKRGLVRRRIEIAAAGHHGERLALVRRSFGSLVLWHKCRE
jgi:hypothetical protein